MGVTFYNDLLNHVIGGTEFTIILSSVSLVCAAYDYFTYVEVRDINEAVNEILDHPAVIEHPAVTNVILRNLHIFDHHNATPVMNKILDNYILLSTVLTDRSLMEKILDSPIILDILLSIDMVRDLTFQDNPTMNKI